MDPWSVRARSLERIHAEARNCRGLRDVRPYCVRTACARTGASASDRGGTGADGAATGLDAGDVHLRELRTVGGPRRSPSRVRDTVLDLRAADAVRDVAVARPCLARGRHASADLRGRARHAPGERCVCRRYRRHHVRRHGRRHRHHADRGRLRHRPSLDVHRGLDHGRRLRRRPHLSIRLMQSAVPKAEVLPAQPYVAGNTVGLAGSF